MRLILKSCCAPRLEAADDFTRFSVRIEFDPGHDLQTVLALVGKADGDGHAWVRPEALRAISPYAGHPEWEARFASMLCVAARHGWSDDLGRIRAHVECDEPPATISPEAFRDAMRRFASGVCIVATGEGEERRGVTVSSFTSVSAKPPLVLVCINRSSSAHATLTGGGVYSVNILAAGQSDLALRFAGQHGVHGAARFDAGWRQSAQGAPVCSQCLQSLICAPAAQHEAGSHTLLIGRVIGVTGGKGGEALVNFRGMLQPAGRAA